MIYDLWRVVYGLCSVVCGLYNNKGFIHWVILPTGWTDNWLVGGWWISLIAATAAAAAVAAAATVISWPSSFGWLLVVVLP